MANSDIGPGRARAVRANLIVAAVAVVTAVTGGCLAGGLWYLDTATGDAGLQTVRINPGMTTRQIGERLAERGLIRSAAVFELIARIRGLTHRLEAGRYELSGGRTTAAILQDLLKAPLEMKRVTVPEGLTRHEIAGLLERGGLADSVRFVRLTEDENLLREFQVDAENFEGYLFPETYFLELDAREEDIVRSMVAEFFRVFSDSLYTRLDSLDFNLHQAVTLASIVELESMVQSERAVISSIFHRRLGFNRRLESCATVEFALGVHKQRLTNADLRVDSPYNTYAHRGLPPGPIGNPGEASILAALYPFETQYLYFVARGDGTHLFSRTNVEHEAAKRAVKRAMRRRSQTN